MPWMVEGCIFECNGEVIDDPEYIFDSVSNEYYLVWDSAQGGDYHITVNTIFLLSQESEYHVESDTMIWVDNQLALTTMDSLSVSALMHADTVEFVHLSSGCFHHNVTKTVLLKTDTGYRVIESGIGADFYSHDWYVNRKEGEKMLVKIATMQTDMLSFIQKNSGTLTYSTSSQTFFIRADRSVYTFHDFGINWNGYAAFEKDYGNVVQDSESK